MKTVNTTTVKEKSVLNRKITGSLYKGKKWSEFPDLFINGLLKVINKPIHYYYVSRTLGDYADKYFGDIDNELFGIKSNLSELVDNFHTMNKDAFFASAEGRKMKIPAEVMSIIIKKLKK